MRTGGDAALTHLGIDDSLSGDGVSHAVQVEPDHLPPGSTATFAAEAPP